MEAKVSFFRFAHCHFDISSDFSHNSPNEMPRSSPFGELGSAMWPSCNRGLPLQFVVCICHTSSDVGADPCFTLSGLMSELRRGVAFLVRRIWKSKKKVTHPAAGHVG